MLQDVSGRVAVVTGAGSGIGSAMVRGFQAAGMSVVASDIDAASAEAVADGLDGVIAAETDVADPQSVDALADQAWSEFGQVDLLCSNAGVFQGGITWERSLEDWRWAFDVNVMGAIHCIKSFVPRMIAQDTDGHVVITASVAAFISAPYSAPYVTSKAAAFSVAEVLAHDLSATGSKIGASVLTPSAFDTGIAGTAAVRQSQYGTDPTEDAAFTAASLASMTAQGLEPDAVVEPVLNGVRNDHFLIATKPSYADQLASRSEALIAKNLPPIGVVD